MRHTILRTVVAIAVVTGGTLPLLAQGLIVVDHTCTDPSQIPDAWLDQARALAIHYAHTSHGTQITTGLEIWEDLDAVRYGQSVFYAWDYPDGPPSALDCESDSLCVFDGNPPYETYITPDLYWQEQYGRDRTEAVADTGLFGFSMWSWCGQLCDGDPGLALYLSTMQGWEGTYPGMRFVLMTNHVCSWSDYIEPNNNAIRTFANDNNMVLFDFNDIERYDPDGNPHLDTSDYCDWCEDWCTAHPDQCANFGNGDPDFTEQCSWGHAHPLLCRLKGGAFWWMMARLAGWDGSLTGSIFADDFENGNTTAWSLVLP